MSAARRHARVPWRVALLAAWMLPPAARGAAESEAERMIELGRNVLGVEAKLRYFTEAIRLAPPWLDAHGAHADRIQRGGDARVLRPRRGRAAPQDLRGEIVVLLLGSRKDGPSDMMKVHRL